MFAIFTFAYGNLHLIFSMKYWTLSLKLHQIMNRTESNNERLSLKINLLFCSLELVIIMGSLCEVIDIYLEKNNNFINDFKAFLPLQIVVYISAIGSCIASLSLLIDALVRLMRCV